MEPFKNKINAEVVTELSEAVRRVHAPFDAEGFRQQAVSGLDQLELKARVGQVGAALRQHLPPDLGEALQVLVAAAELAAAPPANAEGVSEAFSWWPVLRVVEDFGLANPAASLGALPALTRRFSGEFAIRPLLRSEPELAWKAVEQWASHEHPQVRRLCSEGTRPRLPWGDVLRDSVGDPARGLALISRLVDDEALYVRRSVANHLNDVAKDHPKAAVATASSWLEQPTEGRRWAARHGLRTLFRKGDPATLALFGFGPVPLKVTGLQVTPKVDYPGTAELEVTLTPSADASLRVEWVVQAPRWRKVFRGPERALAKDEAWSIRKRFAMKPVSVRTHVSGGHTIGVQVNGEVVGEARFELVGGD